MSEPLFKVHLLNDVGLARAGELADLFQSVLDRIESICGGVGSGGRDLAIVRTKLQEASFFAKRAMAINPAHQR